jgi:hypothetical protein
MLLGREPRLRIETVGFRDARHGQCQADRERYGEAFELRDLSSRQSDPNRCSMNSLISFLTI